MAKSLKIKNLTVFVGRVRQSSDFHDKKISFRQISRLTLSPVTAN
jgi:hypothetical protein